MEDKNDNNIILELKELSKFFGGLGEVQDINIKIHTGELHCIIGPNGSGKTTLFNLIIGELSPTKGQIIFNGENITKKKSWQRAYSGISIKMQIPGVYGDLTVRENIRISLQNHFDNKNIEAEINRLIDFVGIKKLGNPIVKNISHGQQQWLEIAMALSTNPKLLLLDEPVAGMGPDETEFTARLVKKINALGISIIFIDHDMDFVKKIAKQITVLHYGKIFTIGTFEEISSNKDVMEIYLGNV